MNGLSESRVEIRTTRFSEDSDWEDVEIYVNGERVATGNYGGEPEDATRGRDYAWVDCAFEAVAKALGASVEFTERLEDG